MSGTADRARFNMGQQPLITTEFLQRVVNHLAHAIEVEQHNARNRKYWRIVSFEEKSRDEWEMQQIEQLLSELWCCTVEVRDRMLDHELNHAIALKLIKEVFIEVDNGVLHVYKAVPDLEAIAQTNHYRARKGDEVRYASDMGQLLNDLANSEYSDFYLKIEPTDSEGDWYVKLIDCTDDSYSEAWGENITHTFATAVAKFIGVYRHGK